MGDSARARPRAEEALAIARPLDDEALVGLALARVALDEANDMALVHSEASLAISRRSGDLAETVASLRNHGLVHVSATLVCGSDQLPQEHLGLRRHKPNADDGVCIRTVYTFFRLARGLSAGPY